MSTKANLVTLLTDFGYRDSYVAEVKGVLLGSRPGLAIVDITHDVPPYGIEHGAFQLLRCHDRFPEGTFHLAVVDPGVGTKRRCIYVRTRRYHFVGPDNGLLLWAVRACEREEGAKARAYEIPVPPSTGPTFHGRDVFAPFVAKALSRVPAKLREVDRLEGRELPGFRRKGKEVVGEVLAVDHYGNLVTSIPLGEMPSARKGAVGSSGFEVAPSQSYDVIPDDSAALIRGSHGFWEISCRRASAAERLGVKPGDEISLME